MSDVLGELMLDVDARKRGVADRDWWPDLRALLVKVLRMGRGPAQVAVAEEAVRLADAHNDPAAGFLARKRLIEASTHGGRPDVLLVAFSWCLARCDADPTQFKEGDLLWNFKWVLEEAPLFPQVGRQQLEGLFEDMRVRYERAGSTLHAVHETRCNAAMMLGDRAAAAAAYELFRRARRDQLSNCAACVADFEVEYLFFHGEDERAVQAAEELFAGRLRCNSVPHRTYAHVLGPLLRLGRPRDALAHHRTGYPLVAENPRFVRYVAMHLIFLTLIDDLARAMPLLERHLPAALAGAPLWQFEFFRAARILLGRLRDTGRAEVALRLPADFPPNRPDGRYDAAELCRWFDDRLRDLAAQFDARNGNDHFGRRVAELDALRERITPLPGEP
jgi:hypothetical protein